LISGYRGAAGSMPPKKKIQDQIAGGKWGIRVRGVLGKGPGRLGGKQRLQFQRESSLSGPKHWRGYSEKKERHSVNKRRKSKRKSTLENGQAGEKKGTYDWREG